MINLDDVKALVVSQIIIFIVSVPLTYAYNHVMYAAFDLPELTIIQMYCVMFMLIVFQKSWIITNE